MESVNEFCVDHRSYLPEIQTAHIQVDHSANTYFYSFYVQGSMLFSWRHISKNIVEDNGSQYSYMKSNVSLPSAASKIGQLSYVFFGINE